MKPSKKQIKEVMAYMGSKKSPKKTEALKENLKKARAKRWLRKR